MKKRFMTFIFALAAVLIVPTSVFASTGGPDYGAGTWDTIYNQPLNANGGSTPILNSGGGDLRLCINGVAANNKVTMIIYNDNNGIKDGGDIIGPILGQTYEPHSYDQTTEVCFPAVDMRPYVDGTYAEFYVQLKANFSDTVNLRVQD